MKAMSIDRTLQLGKRHDPAAMLGAKLLCRLASSEHQHAGITAVEVQFCRLPLRAEQSLFSHAHVEVAAYHRNSFLWGQRFTRSVVVHASDRDGRAKLGFSTQSAGRTAEDDRLAARDALDPRGRVDGPPAGATDDARGVFECRPSEIAQRPGNQGNYQYRSKSAPIDHQL